MPIKDCRVSHHFRVLAYHLSGVLYGELSSTSPYIFHLCAFENPVIFPHTRALVHKRHHYELILIIIGLSVDLTDLSISEFNFSIILCTRRLHNGCCSDCLLILTQGRALEKHCSHKS